MKYELKINGNILKTDDKDVALGFIKAIAVPATYQHYVAPIMIEKLVPYDSPWPTFPPYTTWGNTGTGCYPSTFPPMHLVTDQSCAPC